ncbi:cytochrome c biogenesis protein CcsA [Marinobacteraceae bacterium S3BR75-40.1]
MGILILAVTTLLLYCLATALQALVFRGKLPPQRKLNLLLGSLAVISHGALTWTMIWQNHALHLGFFPTSVLIAALIVAFLVILAWRRPVHNLFLVAYPLAIVVIIAGLIFHAPPDVYKKVSVGLLAHITLSVTAYSLFSLAAFQAALLLLQDHQLRTNYNSLLIRNLPPLQTMESLLFDLVWSGLILLTLAIVSGALFMEDMFAQHLVHKTVFSLLAWVVFAGLLAGRQIKGWRGATASRWTLSGCALLMLGFYGSKLVLELILKTPHAP